MKKAMLLGLLAASCAQQPSETGRAASGGDGGSGGAQGGATIGGSGSGGDGSGGGSGTTSMCARTASSVLSCEAAYPSPTRAFDEAAKYLGALRADERDGGSAVFAGRVDADDGFATGATVRLHVNLGSGCGIPPVLRVGIALAPGCAMPVDDVEWRDVGADQYSTHGLGDGLVEVVAPLAPPVALELGSETWVLLVMNASSVCPAAYKSQAKEGEARGAWFGLVDRDCNGEADVDADGDPVLGWEDVRYSFEVGGAYDPALGIQLN